MEKKVVQDIVPTGKRSIRSIPTKKVPVEEDEAEERVPIRRTPPPSISLAKSQTRFTAPPPRRPAKISPSGKRRLPSILLTFGIIFIGIAIIAVALSLLYSKAAVTITPKTAQIDVNGTFTAKKGDASATSGTLYYNVVTATESASQSVPAVDGPTISTKAKGTVTLYNEQETQQKIVAGTRLGNAEGEIYRTSATVVVPAGKAAAPGKVDVVVLADQAGTEYNMSLTGATEFKVVAYKDTPKYALVYGKLKTAITGGFNGKKTTVSPDVQKTTVQSLKDSLTAKLMDDVKKQITKDDIMYNNSYAIDYDTPEPTSKAANTADISVKATMSAAVFKKVPLLKSIAAKELDKFPAPTYTINGLKTSSLHLLIARISLLQKKLHSSLVSRVP
jgi:hypothetical protein